MTTLHGSCLCQQVQFTVQGPVRGIGSCHCSQCRKVSGTNGNAQFVIPTERFAWVCGEHHTSSFTLESGWGHARCKTCGSPLPDSFDEGQNMWVQAGLMDDPLETDIKMHIFCASRADWDQESPAAKHFDEYPQ